MAATVLSTIRCIELDCTLSAGIPWLDCCLLGRVCTLEHANQHAQLQLYWPHGGVARIDVRAAGKVSSLSCAYGLLQFACPYMLGFLLVSDKVFAKRMRCLQCQMFTFTGVHFSDDEIEMLEERVDNMLLLQIDVSLEQAKKPLPRPWFYVPYKTNIHYVPAAAGRPVAYADPVSRVDDVWHFNTARVGDAPRSPGWQPQLVAEHSRPILAIYTGFHSRLMTEWALSLKLWAVKYHVRPSSVMCGFVCQAHTFTSTSCATSRTLQLACAHHHVQQGEHLRTLQLGLACTKHPSCFVFALEDRDKSARRLLEQPGMETTVKELGYASSDELRLDLQRYNEAAYLLATFCLTPPGDSPKRRGLHDAWQMGYAFHLDSTLRCQGISASCEACSAQQLRVSSVLIRCVGPAALSRIPCKDGQLSAHMATPAKADLLFNRAVVCRCIPVVFTEASRSLAAWIPDTVADSLSIVLPPRMAADGDQLMQHLQALLPRVPAMRANIAKYVTQLQYSHSELDASDHAQVGPDALDTALWAMTHELDLGVPKPSYTPYSDVLNVTASILASSLAAVGK